ncbi:MAG: hypothetical protein HRT45_05240 [Bdellovibrionales bacterium]|nr:hypothetical protein [Bdellovibrionales bacterium]
MKKVVIICCLIFSSYALSKDNPGSCVYPSDKAKFGSFPPHTKVRRDFDGDGSIDMFYLAGEEDVLSTCIFLSYGTGEKAERMLKHSRDGYYDPVFYFSASPRPVFLSPKPVATKQCDKDSFYNLIPAEMRPELIEAYNTWSKRTRDFNVTYNMEPAFHAVHNLFLLHDVELFDFYHYSKRDLTRQVKEYFPLKKRVIEAALKSDALSKPCESHLKDLLTKTAALVRRHEAYTSPKKGEILFANVNDNLSFRSSKDIKEKIYFLLAQEAVVVLDENIKTHEGVDYILVKRASCRRVHDQHFEFSENSVQWSQCLTDNETKAHQKSVRATLKGWGSSYWGEQNSTENKKYIKQIYRSGHSDASFKGYVALRFLRPASHPAPKPLLDRLAKAKLHLHGGHRLDLWSDEDLKVTSSSVGHSLQKDLNHQNYNLLSKAFPTPYFNDDLSKGKYELTGLEKLSRRDYKPFYSFTQDGATYTVVHVTPNKNTVTSDGYPKDQDYIALLDDSGKVTKIAEGNYFTKLPSGRPYFRDPGLANFIYSWSSIQMDESSQPNTVTAYLESCKENNSKKDKEHDCQMPELETIKQNYQNSKSEITHAFAVFSNYVDDNNVNSNEIDGKYMFCKKHIYFIRGQGSKFEVVDSCDTKTDMGARVPF